MTGLLKCQKSSRETHPRDVIILLVGQVHLLHGADRVLATVLVYPLPVSKQHVLHCEITNHTLGSLLTLDVCSETFQFHVRRLPYMTSATFSDFLTPSLPCHCHKSADFVPAPPTHCRRHIWKPLSWIELMLDWEHSIETLLQK